MKLEDPPNKAVHAEDLLEALHKLRAPKEPVPQSPDSPGGNLSSGRQRSGSSTVLFEPSAEEKGNSPNMPAISVEDTTEMDFSPIDTSTKILHTSRPPVELMQDL
jgi:hypothetical protein